MPVSKTEFEWREWILGEGRYRDKGRRSKPRPAHFPRLIPAVWWARLAAFLARRKVSQTKPLERSIMDDFGTLARNPRGGVEGVYEAIAFGVRWIALNMNVADWTPTPASWDTVINRARNLGIKTFPWMRCYTLMDVKALILWADVRREPAVGLNLEKELDRGVFSEEQVVQAVRESGFQGEVVIFTEGRLYDNVDWTVFVREGYQIALQMFNGGPFTGNVGELIELAHSKGVENPRIVWFAGGFVRTARSGESVYTFDDAAGSWWPRG